MVQSVILYINTIHSSASSNSDTVVEAKLNALWKLNVLCVLTVEEEEEASFYQNEYNNQELKFNLLTSLLRSYSSTVIIFFNSFFLSFFV
jgi:hypothetical protein